MSTGGAGRASQILRRLGSRLREPPIAMLALALLTLLILFFSNSDMGGDPDTPRGDGTYRPVLARGDGHMLFLMTRSLVLDQDLVFDNDLARFGDPWRQKKTATGRKDIPHPIGPALVWAPVLTTAHGMSKVANVFGADIPSHGYTLFHHRVVFLTSVLFGFGTVLLGFLLVRRLLGGRYAPVFAAIAILFGTSITYYSTYMPSYGHAMDAFACAGFFCYWARSFGDLRLRRFVILGLLLGLCALIRVQEFAMGIVLVVELGARMLERPERGNRPQWIARLLGYGLLTLGVAIVVFTPQFIAWKVLYGEFWHTSNGPGYVRYGQPMPLELLFSSRNGWFSTTPLAYAGVIGLFFAPRKLRLIALGLLAALVTQVYLNSCIWDWWAQASYSQRRLCSVTLILVVGLAFLISACNRAARRMPPMARLALAVLVLAWFMAWNLAHVQRLRAGKAPSSHPRKMCCKKVPGPMRTLSQPIYDRIGNPFALPASALFAWQHDVPLKRWDTAVGDYADRPGFDQYTSGAYRKRRFKWNLPGVHFGRYLIGGFGPRQILPPQFGKQKPFRWTTGPRARMIVPLFMPEAHRFSVRVSPNLGPGEAPVRVRVRFNDTVYLERELGGAAGRPPGWTELAFEVPASGIEVGTNELAIEVEPTAYRLDQWKYVGRNKPLPRAPKEREVGVAVRELFISYPRDAPRP